MSKNDMENVILITVDSLRADHLSCYGYEKETSPNMDKIAESGILFKQAISNGGHTRIAFPTILTSTYFFSHRFLKRMNNGFTIYLSDDRPYLPEILKRNGYKTAGFHSNPFLTKRYGYNRGFDMLLDPLEKSIGTKKNIRSFVQNHLNPDGLLYRSLKIVFNRFRHVEPPFAGGEEITKSALSWVKNNRGSPFFLWVHYMDVHHPYLPPKNHLMKFSDKIITSRESITLHTKMLKNSASLSHIDIKNLISLYDGCINYVDYWIGELLNALEGMDVRDSLIILTADHGDAFGEHGEFGHGERSGNLYEEIMRIPLIISAPTLKGSEIHDQVSLLDVAPTILDFLSIQKPDSMQGKSLLTYNNKDKGDGTFAETLNIGAQPYINTKGELNLIKRRGVIAYRTENWKYIHNENMDDELYNLRTDPKEKKNIINEQVEKAEEYKSEILQHLARVEKNMRKVSEKEKINKKIKELKRLNKI
ncbi:MAG: sulfatase [Candidatus Njordarchaeales archaeon]